MLTNILITTMYQTINRTVFSIADLIGLLGGTYSIFCTIAAFFVGIVASKIYVMSLIAGFYKVN